MIGKNPHGESPAIDPTAYIDDTAVVIGNVEIGKNVFVGPLAVIRADEPDSSIVIGDGSNVQDKVVVHAHSATSVVVAGNVSLSHACVVHGPCVIGEGSFVGFGTVIHGATLGKDVFARHSAVIENADIPDGKKIASGTVVTAETATGNLPDIDESDKALAAKILKANLKLNEGYRRHS